MDPTRASIYDLLEDARRELMTAVEGIPPERMTAPVIGDWSAKDILAHIAFWEEIAIPDFQRVARDDTPALAHFQPEKLDTWNELSMAMRRSFPLAQVLRELHDTRQAMKQQLESLPDDAFMTGWAPLYCAITVGHDRQHAEHIRAWREKESA